MCLVSDVKMSFVLHVNLVSDVWCDELVWGLGIGEGDKREHTQSKLEKVNRLLVLGTVLYSLGTYYLTSRG